MLVILLALFDTWKIRSGMDIVGMTINFFQVEIVIMFTEAVDTEYYLIYMVR